MIIIKLYVDDIIFGSNTDNLSQRFVEEMQKEFEISILGELSSFLGLQISKTRKGIFISQIHQGDVEKIQNGRLQTYQSSHGYKIQIKKI